MTIEEKIDELYNLINIVIHDTEKIREDLEAKWEDLDKMGKVIRLTNTGEKYLEKSKKILSNYEIIKEGGLKMPTESEIIEMALHEYYLKQM